MPDDDTRTQQIEARIKPEVSGAIALHGGGGALTIAPRDMAEMFEFAKLMAVSGPCVRAQFRGNPGACLAIALQAFRTGADPFAVANKAYLVTNRAGEAQIAYEAQYIHAVINTSGRLKKRLRPTYSGEGQNRSCLILGEVVGEDEPLRYESPPVKNIGVKNSPLWTGDPDQQLFYYSSRAWARRHLPEVLLGMYTRDEIRGDVIDMDPVDVPPRPRREDYVESSESPLPAEPPPPAEPLYFFADQDGEVHEFAEPEPAAEAYREAINSADRERGEAGVLAAWENGAQLITALREHQRDDLAEALAAHYAEALAAARQKTVDPSPAEQRAKVEQAERKEPARAPLPPEPRAPEDPLPSSAIIYDPLLPAARTAAAATATPATESLGPSDIGEAFKIDLAAHKAVGKPTDWQGVHNEMLRIICSLSSVEEATPRGAFAQANLEALESMRRAAKPLWISVQYYLGDRERQLRETAQGKADG
jgi:RecT family protein